MTITEIQVRRWAVNPVKPNTKRRQMYHLAGLKSFYGDTLVSDITLSSLRQFRTVRLGETTPFMVGQELRHLRTIIDTAISLGVDIPRNPVTPDLLKGLPTAGKRIRYLTEEEFHRLYESVKRPGLKLILKLGVLTGLRAGEMQALNWGDIDFERNLILVRAANTKTGVQREVPMSQEVRNTLLSTRESVRNGPNDPVITTHGGGRYSSIPVSVKKVCDRAGLHDVSAHILRHTFASWALHRGVPAIVVQKLLGHSTMSMTSRYAHPGGDLLQSVMRDFGTQSSTKPSTDLVLTKEAAAA